MAENFQLRLDKYLESLPEGRRPSLLLHVCCAPCASYVLEYLCPRFDVTAFFYNPNIWPPEELTRRGDELRRLVPLLFPENPPGLLFGGVDPAPFYAAARGLEREPEGGARCSACFRLRLRETARRAREGGFDLFGSTLTVGSMKNAAVINSIGQTLAAEYGTEFLPSDFKKRGGYQRSIELCRQYGVYRQHYCGCAFAAGGGK